MGLSQTDSDRMVRVLRHRLRNHISGIKTALDLLENEIGGAGGSVCEYFPLLKKECMHMDSLACRFGFALEDRADGPPAKLGMILERACLRVKKQFPTAQMEIDCSALDGVAVTNSISMENCFYELLANALEAQPGGTVSVRVAMDGEKAVIVFRDCGDVVADEVFGCMKKPFFTTKSKHVGLGLSIAQNALKHSSGSLRIRRRSKSAGLEVCVRVPRVPE